MELSEFKSKHVSGLYSFDHFEHENGAFIQRHVSGSPFVYRGINGDMSEHHTIEAVKKAIISDSNPFTAPRRAAVSRCNANPTRLNQLLKENMQRRCHEWEVANNV